MARVGGRRCAARRDAMRAPRGVDSISPGSGRRARRVARGGEGARGVPGRAGGTSGARGWAGGGGEGSRLAQRPHRFARRGKPSRRPAVRPSVALREPRPRFARGSPLRLRAALPNLHNRFTDGRGGRARERAGRRKRGGWKAGGAKERSTRGAPGVGQRDAASMARRGGVFFFGFATAQGPFVSPVDRRENPQARGRRRRIAGVRTGGRDGCRVVMDGRGADEPGSSRDAVIILPARRSLAAGTSRNEAPETGAKPPRRAFLTPEWGDQSCRQRALGDRPARGSRLPPRTTQRTRTLHAAGARWHRDQRARAQDGRGRSGRGAQRNGSSGEERRRRKNTAKRRSERRRSGEGGSRGGRRDAGEKRGGERRSAEGRRRRIGAPGLGDATGKGRKGGRGRGCGRAVGRAGAGRNAE